MRHSVGGSLLLTLVAGVTLLSATAAGAAPRRSAPVVSQTVPCYGGPSAGPIDVNEQSDIRTYTIGAVTIESGTIVLTNLASGHAYTFHEAGTVTRIGGTGPPRVRFQRRLCHRWVGDLAVAR